MILHVPAEDKKTNQAIYMHNPTLALHEMQGKNANGFGH